MEEDIDKKPVLVYYCQCGKSIMSVGDPTYIALDKQSSKEYIIEQERIEKLIEVQKIEVQKIVDELYKKLTEKYKDK